MRKNKLLYILFALSLLSILGFSYVSDFSERSPIISCRQWGFYSSKGEKYYTHPEKIVLKPWLGPHNVYGMFKIPAGYRNDFFFTVTIDKTEIYCGVMKEAHRKFAEGVNAKPGYYLIKGLFNTRVAIGLILQGKGDQLKQPQNWKVGYINKE
ncbi:MAG: hypothetical protein KME22_28750 [Hassallia sp. WJT32-NPBG1]|nr:hypothetical protein [Hassallia sp. WJT32-NPBG1]